MRPLPFLYRKTAGLTIQSGGEENISRVFGFLRSRMVVPAIFLHTGR